MELFKSRSCKTALRSYNQHIKYTCGDRGSKRQGRERREEGVGKEREREGGGCVSPADHRATAHFPEVPGPGLSQSPLIHLPAEPRLFLVQQSLPISTPLFTCHAPWEAEVGLSPAPHPILFLGRIFLPMWPHHTSSGWDLPCQASLPSSRTDFMASVTLPSCVISSCVLWPRMTRDSQVKSWILCHLAFDSLQIRDVKTVSLRIKGGHHSGLHGTQMPGTARGSEQSFSV